MAHILLVEDDKQLAPVIKEDLEYEHYKVSLADTVQKAKEAFAEGSFDLVILDITLPDGSGYDVCRHIRKRNEEIPIIFLTAHSQPPEKIMGFKLGADDYVTKPFNITELIARIKARFRLIERETISTLSVGSLTISQKTREATVSEKRLELTPKEFDVLWLLMSQKTHVVTREIFLEQVWGTDAVVTTKTIDNTIGTLRKKLEDMNDPNCPKIETKHRIGYQLII
ncbi:MAG: response regulator [Elusimicrobia bacterium]|nr:response regulator [Elusimicrobiota bacterium]